MTRRLPAPLDRYVLIVATGGLLSAAAVAVWLPLAPLRLPRAAALLVALVLTVVVPLRFRRRGAVQGFTLEDGVLAVMLLTLPLGVAPLLHGAGAFLGHALRGKDARKVAFNVGHNMLSASVATAVFALVGSTTASTTNTPLAPRSMFATLCAVLAFNAVNVLALGGLFQRLEGRRMLQTVAEVWRLYAITAAGNVILALLLAVVIGAGPVATALGVSVLVGLHLGIHSYVLAVEERRKTASLHELSRALLDATASPDAIQRILGQVASVFRAGAVELARVDSATVVRYPSGGTRALDDGGVLSDVIRTRTALDLSAESGEHAARLAELGHSCALAAPLTRDGRVVGAIAVYDPRGVEGQRGSELTLLGTVANEVAVAVRSVELFASVERERGRLEEESRKLSDVVAAASDGIALIDATGRVRSWNPAMTATMGIAADEAIGHMWFMALRLRDEHGNDLPLDAATPVAAALRGEPARARLELQALRRDGEWRWLRCTFSPVVRDDGDVAGVVLVAHDITAEHETEQLKTDFIATVSHELRTPLTPLKGFLLTLVDAGDRIPAADLGDFHTSMLRQVERLELLVADLLVVADLDRGELRLRQEVLPLVAAVRDAIAAELQLAQPDRVTLECDGEIHVVGDRPAVVRAVRALVGNALKHTSGPVRVQVGGTAGLATVVVTDEGPGIADGDHDRVFERFTRLGDHLTRATQGSGLGLAIARSLVDRLGGDLTLQSNGERGSTFTMSLHVARSLGVPASNATAVWTQPAIG